tara:strand:- start:462 stop:899 length:438 start_codon:yes stop_codon:yes gene_type:complete
MKKTLILLLLPLITIGQNQEIFFSSNIIFKNLDSIKKELISIKTKYNLFGLQLDCDEVYLGDDFKINTNDLKLDNIKISNQLISRKFHPNCKIKELAVFIDHYKFNYSIYYEIYINADGEITKEMCEVIDLTTNQIYFLEFSGNQ